ncbi:MAG TPA: hypothetical protein VFM14_18360 [Gemmatimonadales bacterium]|nr:hypothetical protein [Gemmatimonadales bacterium]
MVPEAVQEQADEEQREAERIQIAAKVWALITFERLTGGSGGDRLVARCRRPPPDGRGAVASDCGGGVLMTALLVWLYWWLL